MEIIVVLTTWNRPRLLAQSLPQIMREVKAIGAALVISDDQSREPETLRLLYGAHQRFDMDVTVIRREYVRDGRYTAHESTGMHARWSFNYVLENYPTATHILKLDDDIVMVEGAFQKIIDANAAATAAGIEVLATSGIQSKNEATIREHGTFNETITPCAAACLYQAYDIKICFDGKAIHPADITAMGWDWTFSETYRRKFKPNGVAIATCPSVVAHTGLTGAHVRGDEINVNYAGNLDAVLRE